MSPDAYKAELRDWAKEGYLKSLVPKNIPEPDAEDIAQESWRRMWERDPATIDNPASLRGYGARVVHTVTVDLLFLGRRRVKRIVHLKGSDTVIERECLAAGKVVDPPEEECDRQQREDLLYREIAALPPAQRETLELFHLEELKAAEVARRRGVTVSTVYDVAKDAVLELIRKIRKLEADDRPGRDNS